MSSRAGRAWSGEESGGLRKGEYDHYPQAEFEFYPVGWGGVTPYNGLYRGVPPERGTFFKLQVYKRVEISQVEVHERVVAGKSAIQLFKVSLIKTFGTDVSFNLFKAPHEKDKTIYLYW